MPRSKREKRSSDDVSFYGPSAFTLGTVSINLANSPPAISRIPDFSMPENSGTAVVTLTASDPDGDRFIFKLKGNRAIGTVTVSETGEVVYTPGQYFSGYDYVDFV